MQRTRTCFRRARTITQKTGLAPPGPLPTSLFAVIIYSLPFKIGSTTNLSVASGAPYDITTGFDNNGDGVFNDRPSLAPSPGPGVYSTSFGLLSTSQPTATCNEILEQYRQQSTSICR